MEINQFALRGLGVTSLAASMLLVACGGGSGSSGISSSVDGSSSGTDAAPPAQPAWASAGILVVPGEASKVIALTGCVASGSGVGVVVGDLFNASLTVLANGNVSFRAATSAGGSTIELFTLQQGEMTDRSFAMRADAGTPVGISYSGRSTHLGKNFSLSASIGFISRRDISESDLQRIVCSGGITVAAMTPAAAFAPGEARVVSQFLAGVNAADEASRDGRIIGGAFHWLSSWQPVSVANARPGSSVNLSTGALFNGFNYNISSGLAATPAPSRVSYSAALNSGYYSEIYRAAIDGSPQRLTAELNVVNPDPTATFSYILRRNGDQLGGYLD